MSFRTTVIIFLTSALAAASAQAGTFNDEASAIWLGRADQLIVASQADDLGPETAPAYFGSACDGLTADQIRYGGRWPAWATRSLSSFCSGVNLMAHGNPCSAFREAAKNFGLANSARDPAEVVAAAAYLKDISEALVEQAHEARRC